MTNDLAPLSDTTQVPAWLKDSTGPKGLDNIDKEDIIIPRLVLMQAMSPAVADGKASAGDICWSDSGEVVAPAMEPVSVAPVYFVKEYLHFAARESGEGLVGRSFAENSEIAQRAKAQIGQRVDQNTQDSYVESYNFAVWVIDANRPALVTCTRSQIKHAKAWIGLIQGRGTEPYAGRYTISSDTETTKNYKYWVFNFRNDGWVEKDLFDRLKGVYESMKPEHMSSGEASSSEEPTVNVEM